MVTVELLLTILTRILLTGFSLTSTKVMTMIKMMNDVEHGYGYDDNDNCDDAKLYW